MTDRISHRAIEANGYVGDGARALYDDGTWKVPAGGGAASGVVLLEAGGSVPSGTAVGTIVFEKGVTRSAAILADSPTCFLKLDELTGNFLDSSGNSRHFTPGAGVVTGRPSLVDDAGYAAAGSGGARIGNYAGSSGLAANGVSMEFVAKIPATVTLKGGFMKCGTSGNGWSVGIGGTQIDNLGRSLVIGQNGIAWRLPGYTFPTAGGTFHVVITWDTGNTVRLYVNATLVATNTWTTPSTPGSALYVGESEGAFLSSSIDVDNVAWFNSVLRADRVAAHLGSGGRARGWWDGAAIQPLSV